MNQLSRWTCYNDMDEEISHQMGNIATGFVYLGYLFKQAKESELFKEEGFDTIYDYVLEKYNITRTQALRFMQINDIYSIEGNAAEIRPEYIGYGSSKLTEMLGIPEEIRSEIPTNITIKELRSIKADLSEEITSNESCATVAQTLENTNDSAEKDLLKLFVISFFKSHKNEFKSYFNIAKSAVNDEKLTDRVVNDKLFNIIAPSKFKMERMEGYNTIIKESGIKIMPLVAENKGGDYTHVEFLNKFNECYFITIGGSKAENSTIDKDAWTFYYMEPFEDIMPVEVKIAKAIEKPKATSERQKVVKTRPEDDSEEDEDDIDEQIPGQATISDYPGIVPEVEKTVEDTDTVEDIEELPEEELPEEDEKLEEVEKTELEESVQEEESETVAAEIVNTYVDELSFVITKNNINKVMNDFSKEFRQFESYAKNCIEHNMEIEVKVRKKAVSDE